MIDMDFEQFNADIDRFLDRVGDKLRDIIRQSANDVIQKAQTPAAQGGNMPVDTGFLRASLQSSLSGGTSLSGPTSYVMVVAQADAGDVIEFGWTAEYARWVEYGSRGRSGRFFVRNAAAQWPAIVAANAARAAAS